jgi:hypothetical protein
MIKVWTGDYKGADRTNSWANSEAERLSAAFAHDIRAITVDVEALVDQYRKDLRGASRAKIAKFRNLILREFEHQLQQKLYGVFDRLKITFDRIHQDDLDKIFRFGGPPVRPDYYYNPQPGDRDHPYFRVLDGIAGVVRRSLRDLVGSLNSSRLAGDLRPSDEALDALEDRIAKEFVRREYEEVLEEAKHRHAVLSLSLQPGEVFAGNRAARKIFTSARRSLDIIDTYLGPAVFDMLEVTNPSVEIKLITEKDKFGAATRNAYKAFRVEYGRTEVRLVPPKRIHDRYLVTHA